MLAEGSGLRETYAAPRDRLSNEAIADEYLRWQRSQRRRAPITTYQYAAKLESFLGHVTPTPLELVSLGQIESWLGRHRTAARPRGADATLAKECSILRGLYKYALARGLVGHDPTLLLVSPSVRNEHPKPIDDAVWMHLWSSRNLPSDARLVLGAGYFVGLRRAEIVSLGARHISERDCRISGLQRKGGGDDVIEYGELVEIAVDAFPRLIPGGADTFLGPLHAAVRARRDAPTLLDWPESIATSKRKHTVPPNGLDPQLIYRRLHGWLRAAGLAEDAFTPHQLRHSFVTNLLRHAEMPIDLVKVVANHQNIATTMRYRKVAGQELRDFRRRRQERSLRDGYDRWSQ